jgi:hypothetical protein
VADCEINVEPVSPSPREEAPDSREAHRLGHFKVHPPSGKRAALDKKASQLHCGTQ